MSDGGGDTGGGGKGGGSSAGGGDPGKGGGDTGSDKGGGSPTSGYDAEGGSNYNPAAGGGMDTGGGSGIDPFGSAPDPFGGGPTGYAPTDPYSGSGLPPEITGPNLGGSGPTGGDPGLPGAGGGTNTWGNIPGLSGQEFNYLPQSNGPAVGGGVSSVGGDTAGPASLDQLFTGGRYSDEGYGGSWTGNTPATGTSAAAVAAPSNVEGLVDLTGTNNSSSRTSGGGTSQTQAVNSPGLLESLGLGRAVTGGNGLGVLAAGAGLVNNLINGRGDTQSADALRGLAADVMQQRAEIAARSQPQQETGARVSAAGEQQIAQGQGITRQGQDIITSGQNQLPGGQVLQQYVQNGTLPEGYEAQVQQGIQSAIARVTANHANRGMPTDPSRNSVLAEEIRQIEARAPEMRLQLAQSLANTGSGIIQSGNQTINAGTGVVGQGNTTFSTGAGGVTTGTNTANGLINTGLNATGISADIYRTLLGDENAQQQRRGQAIANFAAALNNTPRRAA